MSSIVTIHINQGRQQWQIYAKSQLALQRYLLSSTADSGWMAAYNFDKKENLLKLQDKSIKIRNNLSKQISDIV